MGGIIVTFTVFRYIFSWKRISMENVVNNFKQGKYKEAIYYSTKLLKSGIPPNDLLYLRAICYFRLDLLNEALIDLSDCLLYDYIEKSKVFFFMGIILSRANEFYQSITFLDKAIESDVDSLEYRKIRGFVFLRWNKSMEAIRDFDFVLQEEPEDYEVEVLRAYALGLQGKKEKSLKEFERLVGEFSEDAFVYEYRAALWNEYGMEEEMKKDLEKVFILRSEAKERVDNFIEEDAWNDSEEQL